MSVLRIELTGETAELGVVPAADVARLILLVERAVAHAAAVAMGTPKTTSGRYRGAIEQAVRFRLRAVEEGSVVPVLELPNTLAADADTLELEVATLGESALVSLLEAATEQTAHPAVAKALLDVANGMHVGDRYEAIVFDFVAHDLPRKVRVDGTVRSRRRAYVDSAPAAPIRTDAVVGVLVEADFEKHTARLHTPTDPCCRRQL